MTTVVIVSEDAEPSGLAHHLLELVGWIRAHRPEVALHVVLLRGGPLVHRMHAMAPTTVIAWDDPRQENEGATHLVRSRWGRRGLDLLVDRVGGAILRRRLPQVRADVTYLNGSAALELAPVLHGPRSRTVTRLPDVTEARLRRLPDRALRRLGRTGPVVVTSSGAQRLLEARVPADRIVLDPRQVPAEAPRPRRAPPGPTVVGGWGPADWPGGADLFVRVAWAVRRAAPHLDIAFRWGGCSRRGFSRVATLAGSMGLPGEVEWMGDGDVRRALDDIGVFVATDRDGERAGNDLLAATVVPVVSFDAAGGPAHHRSVPYGDVAAMADEVVELCLHAAPHRDGERPEDDPHVPGPARPAASSDAPRAWIEIERALP